MASSLSGSGFSLSARKQSDRGRDAAATVLLLARWQQGAGSVKILCSSPRIGLAIDYQWLWLGFKKGDAAQSDVTWYNTGPVEREIADSLRTDYCI
jgi:hypothetical protein